MAHTSCPAPSGFPVSDSGRKVYISTKENFSMAICNFSQNFLEFLLIFYEKIAIVDKNLIYVVFGRNVYFFADFRNNIICRTCFYCIAEKSVFLYTLAL